MSARFVAAFVAVLLPAVLLSGCSATGASERPGTSVVAGFYPFAYVAQRVAGGHAAVTNLTPPGVEPHDLELTPKQVVAVAEADLLVYEQGFQPAVDDAVAENTTGTTVEVGRVLGRAAASGRPHDPHIWQDPTELIPVANAIAGRLGDADPAHADEYRANAADLVRDLHALDRQFAHGLAHCQRRTFVTSHAAFGHLADRYGLAQVSIAGLDPTAEPSPRRLAQLKRIAEARHLTTIFTETLVSPSLAQTLADEVGVHTAVLDPIEGLSQTTAGQNYFSLMRSNLATLRKANGCS